MAFIDVIKAKAKADKKRIVLPEGMDRRIWEAAVEIVKDDIADLTVIATEEDVKNNTEGLNLAGINIIDPVRSDKLEKYTADLAELRRMKGMTIDEARELLTTDYVYYACMMLRENEADGVVSGACHSTANTLRPALQLVKAKPGVKLVSAFFIMVVPDCEYGANGTFLFADCGLEQNPDPEKLAAIAVDSANSFAKLVEEEPLVAFLSHSTKGSARHPDIDKVTSAFKIAKEMAPDVKMDGELQLDAAIVPEVGALKAPDSPVAGKANVLIFPDLDAGNIGYKLVHSLPGVVALTSVQAQLQI